MKNFAGHIAMMAMMVMEMPSPGHFVMPLRLDASAAETGRLR